MMIPYRFNYPLLLGSWQGQPLVSLHKLTKSEGLQILGGVGPLEAFYARGYLSDLRTCFRQLLTHNVYIDQHLLDCRLRALGLHHSKLCALQRLEHNRRGTEQ